MEFSGELFPTSWLWSFAALYAWLLSRALRWADWKRLADNVQLNVFLGAIVSVLPGKDGLLHISQIAHERVNSVE